MRGADVGDDAPVGAGDAGQGRDFAGVIHSHFDDSDFVLGLESQQLQGQAEAVIQVAARLEHIELRAEGGGHSFLGGSFAR